MWTRSSCIEVEDVKIATDLIDSGDLPANFIADKAQSLLTAWGGAFELELDTDKAEDHDEQYESENEREAGDVAMFEDIDDLPSKTTKTSGLGSSIITSSESSYHHHQMMLRDRHRPKLSKRDKNNIAKIHALSADEIGRAHV